jgi:hypothetical protein
VIEGKLEGRIETTGRRGRRCKQLLDDLKEKRRYLKLKEEALDRTPWRTGFGRGYGPVVRQTTVLMNLSILFGYFFSDHSSVFFCSKRREIRGVYINFVKKLCGPKNDHEQF